MALTARMGIAALMNIEFLDEAGTGLCPLGEERKPLEGAGGHSDLAQLHCSRLSAGFPAVIADRGLGATTAFKACLSCPNVPIQIPQLLFIGLPGYLVWMFPWRFPCG